MKKELEIANELETLIRSGKLPPEAKIPSEYELAEQYGINRKTANKAVAKLEERGLIYRTRGRGGSKVVPHLPFRGVIAYRLKLISAGVFCAQILQGAQQAASSRNYALQYYEYELPDREHWKKIENSGISGALYSISAPPPEDFPFPSINVLHDFGENFVMSDDYSGGRQAAELFLSNGHVNIAAVSNNQGQSLNSRLSGFMDTLREAGIRTPEKRLIMIPSWEINPRALWEEIRKMTPHVTGIFCFSDAIALQLILHLGSIGVKIPQDFSVCGFGNMRTVNNIFPITTVEQFPENLGYTACTRLIEQIENRTRETIRICSPVELINARATVGPARQAGQVRTSRRNQSGS